MYSAAEGAIAAAAAAPSPFIVGPENSLVRELVRSVTLDTPPYNPLVIYGSSGVGKSTLAHLLADQRQQSRRLAHVLRATAADVVQALAHAADTNSVADLRAQYHRCDLLVLDDLQGLVERPAAQQFLTATLDVLIRRGVLVIATLRQLPVEAEILAPPLASRLSAGLVVPLVPPELLARQAIVRQLASQFDLRLTDDEVTRLAGRGSRRLGSTTVPQLRHAIMQCAAQAEPPNCMTAPGEDFDTKAVFRQTTAAVARHFRLTVGEIKSKSRRQHLVEARSLAMHLCRELTDASYVEIGRHFGNRDHSTVLHACQKIRERLANDPAARRTAADLMTQIATEPART